MKAANKANIPRPLKATEREKTSPIMPITAGPIKKPITPEVAMPEIPIVGLSGFCMADKTNNKGMIMEKPMPVREKPEIIPTVNGKFAATKRPAAPIKIPYRTSKIG